MWQGDPHTETAPEVMLNKNDQREAIRRILHDFVMLKLAGDTTIKQVAERLEASTDELYRVFEDDLTQYRAMLDAMLNSSYASGPGGVAMMAQDARKMRESFKAIREAFNDVECPHTAGPIAERVVKLVKENQAHQQERFDFLAHGRMCELLEGAGYSPDEPGVQALLLERNDLHRTVQEVEKAVYFADLADPKLRQFSLSNAVARIATDLVHVRKTLKRIGEHVENGLR